MHTIIRRYICKPRQKFSLLKKYKMSNLAKNTTTSTLVTERLIRDFSLPPTCTSPTQSLCLYKIALHK